MVKWYSILKYRKKFNITVILTIQVHRASYIHSSQSSHLKFDRRLCIRFLQCNAPLYERSEPHLLSPKSPMTRIPDTNCIVRIRKLLRSSVIYFNWWKSRACVGAASKRISVDGRPTDRPMTFNTKTSGEWIFFRTSRQNFFCTFTPPQVANAILLFRDWRTPTILENFEPLNRMKKQ